MAIKDLLGKTKDAMKAVKDKTVDIICTSFLNPSGNNGLIGLSIIRAANVAASLGLPSLLINPPGIFPTEYNFS